MPHDGPVTNKYLVSRVDGRDLGDGDKKDAKYFVLDYIHDPVAIQALKFYAFICQEQYPKLSESIWLLLREAAKITTNKKDGN